MNCFAHHHHLWRGHKGRGIPHSRLLERRSLPGARFGGRGLALIGWGRGLWCIATAGFLQIATIVAPAAEYLYGVANSKHNLSFSGTGEIRSSTEGDICIFCHAPHHASSEGPLWNHQMPVTGYTPYSSSTLKATVGQPTGSSKLCLSCHDGTVALDSYGGNIPPANTENLWTFDQNKAIGGASGTDLSDDHPISIDYTSGHLDVGVTGGLYDPSTTNSTLGGTITEDLLLNNRVECSSCHDVHNKYGGTYLLKISNTASGLCLTCHWK